MRDAAMPMPDMPASAAPAMPGSGMPAMSSLDILGSDNIRAVLFGEMRVRERPNAEIEWRAPGNGENGRILAGYPAVFNQVTTLFEGKRFVMREQIAPGFFDDVLSDDCHLNYVHESASSMARNGIEGLGGMRLTVDSHGLNVHARLPLDDLDVQRLAPKMDRGVVDQMSFAFSVAEEECRISQDDQGREVYDYTLTKCKRLYDVCVCPLGAYSQTEALLRSALAGQLAGHSQEGPPSVDRHSDEGDRAGDGHSAEGHQRARLVLACEFEAEALRFQPRKDAS